jgi:hypothetical protein
MPNIKRLPSMPNEDELYAALEKMEATDAASITILRKRSQHKPLRNIISGLWFAILYRAVEQRTSSDKGMRKDSRCCAIRNLVACLRAGKEISGRNNNVSKIISKRMRSGRASWSTISEEPGLLAVFNFSNPPSEEELHELQFGLDDDELRHSVGCYQTVVQRILIFIEKTVRRTKSLYDYLADTLRDVNDLVNCETHRQGDDVEATAILSYSYDAISFEATFNQSTYPRYTVQYDSPIFICVQSGDIDGARALLKAGMASIYVVDLYNLELLYVRKRIQP